MGYINELSTYLEIHSNATERKCLPVLQAALARDMRWLAPCGNNRALHKSDKLMLCCMKPPGLVGTPFKNNDMMPGLMSRCTNASACIRAAADAKLKDHSQTRWASRHEPCNFITTAKSVVAASITNAAPYCLYRAGNACRPSPCKSLSADATPGWAHARMQSCQFSKHV